MRHSWFGPLIAEKYGFSAPYTDDDLLSFFELQTALHDEVMANLEPDEGLEPEPRLHKDGKLAPTAWSAYARQLSAEGNMPAAISGAILDKFGLRVARNTISRMLSYHRQRELAVA